MLDIVTSNGIMIDDAELGFVYGDSVDVLFHLRCTPVRVLVYSYLR